MRPDARCAMVVALLIEAGHQHGRPAYWLTRAAQEIEALADEIGRMKRGPLKVHQPQLR